MVRVNVLNCFFQSVFTREPDGAPPTLPSRKIEMEELTNATFTEEDVVEKLKNQKPDKSPGLDQIHPHVLKECADEMGTPLYLIFCKSIQEGKVPEDWRRAKVTPIFKKGAKKPS